MFLTTWSGLSLRTNRYRTDRLLRYCVFRRVSSLSQRSLDYRISGKGITRSNVHCSSHTIHLGTSRLHSPTCTSFSTQLLLLRIACTNTMSPRKNALASFLSEQKQKFLEDVTKGRQQDWTIVMGNEAGGVSDNALQSRAGSRNKQTLTVSPVPSLMRGMLRQSAVFPLYRCSKHHDRTYTYGLRICMLFHWPGSAHHAPIYFA